MSRSGISSPDEFLVCQSQKSRLIVTKI